MSDTEEKKERPLLHISVRNLVEFILRSGSIDDRTGAGDPVLSMQAGSRIHKKIQHSMGRDYHAEVPLSCTVQYPEADLVVEGRADGVFMHSAEDRPYGIDEIKGVRMNLEAMEAPEPVHRAQALCYAYMIAEQSDLPEVFVQLTYVHLDTEEIRRFPETVSREALQSFFSDLTGQYRRWAALTVQMDEGTVQSSRELEFPYPYRAGQRELCEYVYRTIWHHETLFLEAPTGTGKTAAVLFPAVKAVGEGLIKKIFYLTSKTVTKTVARDTFHVFADRGYRAKTVDITSKERICPLQEEKGECACNPDDCIYADGHFDRVNDCVYDMLTEKDFFSRETILHRAKERRVCPYQLGLDLADWCSNVICDYNYVFDPEAYLKRFFSEGRKPEAVFLIDEAHNLVDRGREMYSAALSSSDVTAVKKLLKHCGQRYTRACTGVQHQLLAIKKQYSIPSVLKNIDPLILSVLRLSALLEEFMEKRIHIKDEDAVRTFYYNCRKFLSVSDSLDEHFLIWCDPAADFTVHLDCVDPSGMLTARYARGVATVLFSATFVPLSYYRHLLTTEEKPYAVYARSVFRPENRRILIADDVTTRYRERSAPMYERYASYIGTMCAARKGNYIAFFPSYAFLGEVLTAFIRKYGPLFDTAVQTEGMPEQDRAAFLTEFQEDRPKSLVGFCVMGGIFGEGIDLKAGRLIGVCIAGTGLPGVSPEREMIAGFFRSQGLDGFYYSYLIPGMARVEQAAGRVIRTESDRGVILLLDSRFLTDEYRRNFPKEWSDAVPVSLSTCNKALDAFWEQDQKKVQETAEDPAEL